ncbi:MAG: HIRAN domain-containing protein [Solobacterium sp.]|nr:HIRAN domain-containing protein [Solobacterium sp.]
MFSEKTYITITHLDFYGGHTIFRVGDILHLEKEKDNPYDDEAIIAFLHGSKCGYVANSVYSVARGTQSAGRIIDKIQQNAQCKVLFITEDLLIAELI